MEFKKLSKKDITIAIIFIIYLIFDIKTPEIICKFLDNMFGNIVIGIIALYIFYISNPIVGILGLLVAFQFITRCNFNNNPITNLTNATSNTFTSPFKYAPITLEEEMVSKMAPLVVEDTSNNKVLPIMSNQNNAVSVN
jgi:hypothetical protein